MAPLNKVCKKTSTKDGRNAKQRRADKKRATRLASEAHLTEVATALKNRMRHQSNRWLNYNLGAPDVRGGQNELRWGFKWDTQLCERLDIERAEARRAAGVGPEAWVDDWWTQTVAGGVAGAGDIAGSSTIIRARAEDEKEGGNHMEQDMEDEDGKKPEDKDDDEDEDDDE